MSKINNTQINNTSVVAIAMLIHNFIKYNNDYSKILGTLCQYHTDEPALTDFGGYKQCFVSA